MMSSLAEVHLAGSLSIGRPRELAGKDSRRVRCAGQRETTKEAVPVPVARASLPSEEK
jgi:hypothetical protein